MTFQEDYVALSLLPFFGDGHLLWASDYPHPDSVWPHSRDAIERQMHTLTPQMRRALTHDNAAGLYGLVLRPRTSIAACSYRFHQPMVAAVGGGVISMPLQFSQGGGGFSRTDYMRR